MGGLIETNSKGPDKEPQMDKNDYYNTDVPEERRKARNDCILKRWEQLHAFNLKQLDETIKYLLYVNAGGAVTILAFMGTSESIRNSHYLQIALLCYALGVMCVGLLRVILLRKTTYLFESWRKDAEKYWKGKIGYNKLDEDDDKRSDEKEWISWLVGYISGGLAILGLIFGAIGLFTQC